MPEMEFDLLWPDGRQMRCYSPSLVVEEHFVAGESYPLPDLVARSRQAMTEASERVRARYGFACSRAMATLSAIETAAADFTTEPEARVAVTAFRRLS